ncbi:MAG: alpha/beta hydrolase [Pirellulales bacterium]
MTMKARASFTPHSAMNSLPIPSFIRLVQALAALAGLCAVFSASVRAEAIAEDFPAVTCPDGDVWLVSTRRLPGICRLPAQAALDVEQRCGSRWERSDLVNLLDDPSRPLVIFIHGNRYEPHDAKSQGSTVARQVAGICPAGGRARTVVFSWPSAQQGRLIPSSRENYRRSSTDAHYLAWLLGQLDPAQPVAVIGYSLGAKIAVGAIEDLVEAGHATGRSPWAERTGRSHLVLVAPAVPSDTFSPRGASAPAIAGIDRLTLVINSRDLALRMFPHLDRLEGADALGTVGMPRRWLPEGVEFTATDAASIVGKRHAFPLYLESPALVRRIASGAISGLIGD